MSQHGSPRYLSVAIATPVTADFRPDTQRLVAFAKDLMSRGVDGITIFGTTGEGPIFSVRDRMATLDALIASGIDPREITVSIGALPAPDVVVLAQHATQSGVRGCLLMPPCVFRSGIQDEGTFAYYRQVIEAVDAPQLRLYLYNFPDISGVTITNNVVRRLVQRFGSQIAGIKDSGGDPEVTKQYILSFGQLEIFTGNEIDLPELAPLGIGGTICGLANIMPEFMRVLVDVPNSYDGLGPLAELRAADAVVSRYAFVPSAKAIIADAMNDPEWLRVMPPLTPIPGQQRGQVVADYKAWHTKVLQTYAAMIESDESDNVVPMRRA